MDLQNVSRHILEGKRRYWFKRKKYGWGWTPATWEGWLTLVIFIVLFTVNIVRISNSAQEPQGMSLSYFLPIILLILIFIGICWKTGESPRWQWGSTEAEDHPVKE